MWSIVSLQNILNVPIYLWYIDTFSIIGDLKNILPLLLTLTTLPGFTMAVSINQGRPKQTKMSKTLLPMALDTAMSPWPEYKT